MKTVKKLKKMGKMKTIITLNGYNFFEHSRRENPITEMDSPRRIGSDSCPNKFIFDDYFGPNGLEKRIFYTCRQ